MSVEIRFEHPVGTVIQTRQFQSGQELRVTGKVRGWSGLGEIFTPVTLDIQNGFSPIHIESSTNPVGNYWFDIKLPSTQSQAVVRVSANLAFSGWEYHEVSIGIGTLPPHEEPPPGALDWVKLIPLILVVALAIWAYRKVKK